MDRQHPGDPCSWDGRADDHQRSGDPSRLVVQRSVTSISPRTLLGSYPGRLRRELRALRRRTCRLYPLWGAWCQSAAVTAAGHSPLFAKLMAGISDLIRETGIESLSQPDRPVNSLRGHRRIADAIRAGDAEAAAQAMHEHVATVSDVALLRD
jgi:hypothetical protein